MNRIKVLPESVAHQIAAGEVIERPLSVVKELVENSIDSGASQIDIYVKSGGTELIKIVDNGTGIIKDDLPISLVQHATSKIRATEDLFTINSLGFRGEALASIASIALITITSRAKGEERAWKINNSTNEVEPAAHSAGTTVEVRDLFYNVPVRKKFLRTENTEYLHIEQMFTKLALGNFAIRFRLFKDDKLVKNIPASLDKASGEIRVRTILGKEFVDNCSYIETEQNGISLRGWLGLPRFDRPQADKQFFYLNNRNIKDRVISHAIRQSFLELDPNLRYPAFCLYLTIDASEVDVNVHPTKSEVRFRNARTVHDFITDTIQEYLACSVSEEVSVIENDSPHDIGLGEQSTSFSDLISNKYNEDTYSNNFDYKSLNKLSFGKNSDGNAHKTPNIYDDMLVRAVSDKVSVDTFDIDDYMIVSSKIACVKVRQGMKIIHIERTWKNNMQSLGVKEIRSNAKLNKFGLLEPIQVNVDYNVADYFNGDSSIFEVLGLEIDRLSDTTIIIRSVPKLLENYDWKKAEPALIGIINKRASQDIVDNEFLLKSFIQDLPVPELENEDVLELIKNTNNLSEKLLTEKELIGLL